MPARPRIKDIASRSGVSISTVSLVLNDKPGASQETRQRVLQMAAELGYPLDSAPAHTPAPSTIGMLIKTDPDSPPQANPFYSKVIMGIEEVCRRHGLRLLFAALPVDDDNHIVEVPPLLYDDTLDGLLLVGTFVDGPLDALPARRTPPIVLVDGYSNTDRYDQVVSDNFRAAYQAVTYLINKNHRQIGLVGGTPDSYPSLMERRYGYLRALKEHRLSEHYMADFNINRSKGYDETIALLQEYPHLTALFCVNDDVASHAIRAVKSLGKSVPADISIIGYDDTYIAQNTHPALTTMHVDTVTMGRAAVYLLNLRIEQPDSARMSLVIHPTLIERESVAPR